MLLRGENEYKLSKISTTDVYLYVPNMIVSSISSDILHSITVVTFHTKNSN